MKIILLFILILNSFLFASNKITEKEKKARVEKQIKKEIEKEKEYARKQTFYIDLDDAKVNEESLKNVPKLEIDDFDMDSVYD